MTTAHFGVLASEPHRWSAKTICTPEARRIGLFSRPPVVWKAPPSLDPSSEVPEVRS